MRSSKTQPALTTNKLEMNCKICQPFKDFRIASSFAFNYKFEAIFFLHRVPKIEFLSKIKYVIEKDHVITKNQDIPIVSFLNIILKKNYHQQ